VKRLLIGLVVLAMAAFALEDRRRHKRQARDERAAIVRLRGEVDSLSRFERALANDSATQERVARELYGMIRPGELLYQVVPPDSARR
jgi:cell division protein FtsB